MERREDFRDLDICSVDPPGCTDIDDALHCRDLPNGNLEVHLQHIPTSIRDLIEFNVCILTIDNLTTFAVLRLGYT